MPLYIIPITQHQQLAIQQQKDGGVSAENETFRRKISIFRTRDTCFYMHMSLTASDASLSSYAGLFCLFLGNGGMQFSTLFCCGVTCQHKMLVTATEQTLLLDFRIGNKNIAAKCVLNPRHSGTASDAFRFVHYIASARLYSRLYCTSSKLMLEYNLALETSQCFECVKYRQLICSHLDMQLHNSSERVPWHPRQD